MAEIKKDQERDELFRRIYKIATDLVHAGHVAEWDFKSYVLGTMFYRYISENFTAYINEGEYAAGNKAFDYAKCRTLRRRLPVRDWCRKRASSFCPPNCSAMSSPGRTRTTT